MKLSLILVGLLMTGHLAFSQNNETNTATFSTVDSANDNSSQLNESTPALASEHTTVVMDLTGPDASNGTSNPTSNPTGTPATPVNQPTSSNTKQVDGATSPTTPNATTSTVKPVSSNFDAGSFVGGFVLCGAIVLLIYIGCKLFRNKKPDYNTI